MSKRLQVILAEEEFEQIRTIAGAEGMTVSEWVRQVIRRARSHHPSGDASRKLAAVRAATRHSFPTGDIETMLSEIERGYEGR
jgi:hypothetical protein